MAYATKQDLIDRFGQTELVQLTDKVNKPATTINDTTVTRALDDASAFADTYLAPALITPFVTAPPVLIKAVCDIARYYLFGKAAEKDGEVERSYREAVKLLGDISTGKANLSQSGVAPEAAGGGAVKISTPDRVFTRDTLGGL